MAMLDAQRIKDMEYAGGKNNCYQNIINRIPPHTVLIEAYAGSGAITRRIRPAQTNILIDVDPQTITRLHRNFSDGRPQIVQADCLEWLRAYPFSGSEFVYADPPYLMECRSSPRKIYNFEYTEADHKRMIGVLKSLPCHVMISGYWSELYASLLDGWHTHSFEAQTRNGTATEWLWMNYPAPTVLHDYQYLGENFRERETIKRRTDGMVRRIGALSPAEQQKILSELSDKRIVLQHRHSCDDGQQP